MCLLCYFDLDQCSLIVEISWTAFRKGNCVFFQLNSYVIKTNCATNVHISCPESKVIHISNPSRSGPSRPAPALHSWLSSTAEAKLGPKASARFAFRKVLEILRPGVAGTCLLLETNRQDWEGYLIPKRLISPKFAGIQIFVRFSDGGTKLSADHLS